MKESRQTFENKIEPKQRLEKRDTTSPNMTPIPAPPPTPAPAPAPRFVYYPTITWETVLPL